MSGAYLTLVFAANYFIYVTGHVSAEGYQQEREACDHIDPPKFPTTADELREVCRFGKEYVGCVLTDKGKYLDDQDNLKRFSDIIDYMHKVCDEDNEIFQVISSNIKCIRSSVEHALYSCFHSDVLNKTLHLLKYEKVQFEEIYGREMGDDEENCLWGLYHTSCESINFGVKCGFEVGVAVKDIMNHFKVDPVCTEQIKGELSMFIDVIEMFILESAEGEESPSEETHRKKRFASQFHLFR